MNNDNTWKILALILFVVSAGLGLLWNAERTGNTAKKDLATLQESPFTQSVNAVVSGQVAAINKQSITLKKGGDTLSLIFGENMVFSKILSQPVTGQVPERKEINIEDVQVGDTVDIFSKVMENGSLQALRVSVRGFSPQAQ